MEQTATRPTSVRKAVRDAALIGMASAGHNIYEIAEAVSVAPSTVSRALNTDDAQEILKNVCRKYLAAADDVSKKFLELLNDDDKALRFKVIQEYHRITGLTPSHAPSTIIQQVFQDNRQIKVELSHYREYLAFMMQRQADEAGGDVIPDVADTQASTSDE